MTIKRYLVEVNYGVSQLLWVTATTPQKAESEAEEKVMAFIRRLPINTTGFKGKLITVEEPETENDKGE